MKNCKGFTLIEALLSVVLLGLIAYGASAFYLTGLQSLDEQADRILLDSNLRGRMEILISTTFDEVVDGSEIVNVNGKDYTISWTATLTDLDDDSTPEPTAKQVTVSIGGIPSRSLTTIIVDNQGMVGKI